MPRPLPGSFIRRQRYSHRGSTESLKNAHTIKVLFVCLGNICRSPTAHGVFEALVREHGLDDVIEVDSAGTSGWHIGAAADPRSAEAAARRGYDMGHIRARQVERGDFDDFDYILAMDEQNLADLKTLQPDRFRGCLDLFLSFSEAYSGQPVPDPYYGGNQGFEQVLDMVEDGSRGLLQRIVGQLKAEERRQ